MGTWGVGLYADDTACDVRDQLNDYLLGGDDAKSAIKKLTAELGDEDEPAFWFALADCLWKRGLLTPAVKCKALTIIASGADLAVWQEDAPELVGKRRTVLEKLRQRLEQPQPQAKPVRRSWKDQPSGLQVGDVVWYSADRGAGVALLVHGPTLRHLPANQIWKASLSCHVFDWFKRQPPTPTDLRSTCLLGQFEPDWDYFVEHSERPFEECPRRWVPFNVDIYARTQRDFPSTGLERLASGWPLPPVRSNAASVADWGDGAQSVWNVVKRLRKEAQPPT